VSEQAASPDMVTELERVPIDDLSFSQYNPRAMSQIELSKLARSIDEFGFVDPIVVNRRLARLGFEREALTIVGGHQRVRAAILLGWTEVPAVFVELSPGGEKALNLALNKIQGEWDGAMLADVLAELRIDPDIDELLTGFDETEIDKLIEATQIEFPDQFPAVDPDDLKKSADVTCPSCGFVFEPQK
jgi:ParB-like chromosome segregation protein Spo0J